MLVLDALFLPKVMEQQNKQFNLTSMLHLPWCFYLIFGGLAIQNNFSMKKSCAYCSISNLLRLLLIFSHFIIFDRSTTLYLRGKCLARMLSITLLMIQKLQIFCMKYIMFLTVLSRQINAVVIFVTNLFFKNNIFMSSRTML